ncbi:hypothetical protein BGZ98_008756 [Dissophora globulifera]|nr:hypothetical protein BGZ98_008756 [Dissophora globulifera]
MPAETKRKFQTGQPVSTRRRAKKAKLAAVESQRVATTPSKRDRRKSTRPSSHIMTEQGQERHSSGNHSSDKDGDETVSEYQQDQDDQGDVDALTGQSWSSDADNDTDQDEEEDEVESEQEPAEKSTKGYRKKVKKPSGKKGKIFADTRAMLSIIAQVAGKEEERAQIKQTQMGKIKSKSSIKEQKQAEKEQARKRLIEQKIDEIKRRKTEKRKDAKNRAEKEAEAAASAAPRKSVSFQ